ncbi:glucose-6-phosphate dehydrogenase assembly protein OpcA [Okeania sp.]|uniref:glucose-6-phosphate dehydrogenase assembly protein OpcA n=1 Tax=Okeania sp. TaxID=3100323 RepID=UPI002B4B2433|nr:glucose-6-phosphate dehydrogenase assembly protein OpcA [Okeania sp.]MEB3341247.1 glucose-6-phosphate dehydrogenase assembly protein OpcA [Okeania sp.]
MNTPIVALQQPKDISLGEIEEELSKIWLSQNQAKATPIATRAATFSIVVYEPEEFQQLLGSLGFYDGPIDGIHGPKTRSAVKEAQNVYKLTITGRVDPQTLAKLREEFAKQPDDRQRVTNTNLRGSSMADAIAAQNPSRVMTLCPIIGEEDTGVTAQVSAYCPIQKQSSSNLVCCEYVTLRGTKLAMQRVDETVKSLMIPDLPKFVWWKATPNTEQELFRTLCETSNCIIMDSCYFSDPESEFLKMQELIENETYIADLNWHRLSAWQELIAATFDPPKRRAALWEVDIITIDYEKGNAAQALMFLGWFASRLSWQPISYTEVGGDYDIVHIKFTGRNNQEILAELAAIPTADFGEIPGDLVGIRLGSSNPNADVDCCTILCSETTGCIRLESGGKAQSCLTEQVTALSDQKAEALMAQQLQRWGQDVLYEESLALTAQMLRLRS